MQSNLEIPVVTIWCLCYNHESYIRQCLDGFVMQKTNFPFVAIVHDDASTDKSAEIIREYAERYPNIIKPIFETENQYSKGTLDHIMQEACKASECKYIALCEGDDYWIDPLKLQKQVDFLETHLEYGMCYTRVKQYDETKKIFIDEWGGPAETFDDLLSKNTIPTLTSVIRANILNDYFAEICPESKGWKLGDYPLWLYTSYSSKVKFINEITGIYRRSANTASHPQSVEGHLNFVLSALSIKHFYMQKKGRISKQRIIYDQWCIKLRAYAIYYQWDSFLQCWYSGIYRHPNYLFKPSHLKYFLFFFSNKLRNSRL